MRRLTNQPQIHIYYAPTKPRILPTTLLGGILNCLVLFPSHQSNQSCDSSKKWTAHDYSGFYNEGSAWHRVCSADIAYLVCSLGFIPSFDLMLLFLCGYQKPFNYLGQCLMYPRVIYIMINGLGLQLES